MKKPDEFTSDKEIIEGIRADDSSAERALYDKYRRSMMVAARSTGLSREDAEEIIQDVFLRIFQRMKAGRVGDNVGPLLRTSARNEAISHYRKESTRGAHEAEALDPTAHIHGLAEEPDIVSYLKVLIQQAKKSLTVDDQRVADWIGHGATNSELAEYLDTNENNARQRRNRVLTRLKKRILEIVAGLPDSDRRKILATILGQT